jgi:uncharacterized protein (TIGR02996 family)
MPRYQLDGEAWEIVQNGKELALVAGGKATTRKFVSPDHAAIQYAKLIAEKEAAGWKQVAGGAPLVVSAFDEPREPELERAILERLDDRDAYSVYADWYQARQHPRGELIALQLAEPTRKLNDAVEKHLARYKSELLGPLARHATGDSLIWRNGFIQGLVFGEEDQPAEVIRDVLNHPSGRFLTSLELKIHDERALADALAALAPAHATLQELSIGTGAAIAGLDKLAGFTKLRTVSLATLSRESFRHHELRALAQLPVTCEALHLRFDGVGKDFWSDLAPLFARGDLQLRTLTMRVPRYIDEILGALADGPLAPHVESLDFALTTPSGHAEEGLRKFLVKRGRFAKLREVTASVERLTLEVRTMLKAHYKVIDVRDDDLAEEIGFNEDYYDEVQE